MRRHALAFVFLTVLIDTIGFGIILPVTPDLIVALTGANLADAVAKAGWLLVVFAALQFLFGPVMGNLSDRFGRRPVLLLSLLAFGLDYLLMGLAPTFSWLFLGRAIAGMAGAVYSPAFAYVADISPPEKRAQSFGLVGAAFGVGFILGPALGGFLGMLGPRAPFLASAALALLNAVYGYFALPESLPVERRRPFDWRRANVLGTFRVLAADRTVLALAGSLLVWQIAHQVYPSTWSFFTKLQFGWSAGQIGASLAFAGLVMATTQGYLTGLLVPRLGERRAVFLGLASGIVGFVALGLASAGWMLYVILVINALQGLVYPSLNSLMSRRCPPDAQGELQGGLSSLTSLSSIVGPFLMTQTLRRFSEPGQSPHFPGAPFLLAAFLALCCLALVLVMRGRLAPPPDMQQP